MPRKTKIRSFSLPIDVANNLELYCKLNMLNASFAVTQAIETMLKTEVDVLPVGRRVFTEASS